MASEVHGVVASAFVVAMERAGFDPEPIVRLMRRSGAKYAMQHRVDWDQFVAAVEHVRRAHGEQGVVKVTGHFTCAMPLFTWISNTLLPPKAVYLAAFEIWQVSWFIPMRLDDHGSTLEFEATLPEGYKSSPTFFSMFPVVFSTMPRLFGGADARVETHELTGRSVRLEVTPPRARASGLKFTEAQLADIRTALKGRVKHNARVTGVRVPTVAALQDAWAMTRAEARVARRLAEGASLKQIAKALGISEETARTHAKRAMQKSDTHRQAELVALMLRLGAS